jgi:hypothetical protein
MSWFSDFFTSPQEREGRSKFGDLNTEVANLQSGFGSTNTLADMYKNFGLTKRTAADVSRSFNPARQNLATRLSRSRGSAAARMSGANATPEMTFAPIEQSFADAFGNLEDTAAQTGLNTEIQGEQYGANMLENILGKKDQFAMNKIGLKEQALRDYLSTLSSSSSFDDIMGIAGTASKFLPVAFPGTYGLGKKPGAAGT